MSFIIKFTSEGRRRKPSFSLTMLIVDISTKKWYICLSYTSLVQYCVGGISPEPAYNVTFLTGDSLSWVYIIVCIVVVFGANLLLTVWRLLDNRCFIHFYSFFFQRNGDGCKNVEINKSVPVPISLSVCLYSFLPAGLLKGLPFKSVRPHWERMQFVTLKWLFVTKG